MAAIQRFTTNMGKRLGLKVSDRYREVAAIRSWPHLEVRLYCNFKTFLLIFVCYLYIRVSVTRTRREITRNTSNNKEF